MATTLRQLVRNFIGQMASTDEEKAEAKELLDRLAEKPVARAAQSGIRYARVQKKGGRRG